jgi:hypothetical protein
MAGASASAVLAFFTAALAAALAAVELLLPMRMMLNRNLMEWRERCDAGAVRKEEDDDSGGVG